MSVSKTSDGNTSVGGGSYIQAKLNLVDLAGSERAKRTGAVGSRLKESVGINQVDFNHVNLLDKSHISVNLTGLIVSGQGYSRAHQHANSSRSVPRVQADALSTRFTGRQQSDSDAGLYLVGGE